MSQPPAGPAAPESGDHGHGHGHGHGEQDSAPVHRRGSLGGLWARLRHRVVPHSHDSAGKVDRELETSRDGIRALWVSFVALLVTSMAQAVVVVASGSVALLGDTIHNLADALTAVPIAIAFVLGRRAATRRYTYGYGRDEDLAGIVVVLLIAASAAFAGYEAITRLLHPQPVGYLWAVAAAGVVGFVGNELVAEYRIRVGQRIGSAALVADGLHARTDGFTSLAVVLGAGGVALGFPLADPIIGLLITVAIVFVLRDAAREVYRRLMDAVDPALVDQAETAARATVGVGGVTDLRLRWIGHALRAEVAITVAETLSLVEAHHIAHATEAALIDAVPRLTAAHVHPGPPGPARYEQRPAPPANGAKVLSTDMNVPGGR